MTRYSLPSGKPSAVLLRLRSSGSGPDPWLSADGSRRQWLLVNPGGWLGGGHFHPLWPHFSRQPGAWSQNDVAW